MSKVSKKIPTDEGLEGPSPQRNSSKLQISLTIFQNAEWKCEFWIRL